MVRQSRERVLIVVLNWNGADVTIEALNHACSQEYRGTSLLVIDNGSTDDSLVRLRGAVQPPHRLLPLRANLGFAGGMNVGLLQGSRSGFDYVWLLNNDAFPRFDCLSILVQFMEHNPGVVIAAPRVLGTHGSEEYTGGRVVGVDGELEFLQASELTEKPAFGSYVSGTAMLVRLSGLRTPGRFDERFFAYWEDVDLCTRVLRRGGDIRAVPEAACVHLRSASSGQESPFQHYMHIRNKWLFLKKHLDPCTRRTALLRFVAEYVESARTLASEGQDHLAAVVLGAVQAVICGRYGAPPRQLEVARGLKQLLLFRPDWLSPLLEATARRLDIRNRNSLPCRTELFGR